MYLQNVSLFCMFYANINKNCSSYENLNFSEITGFLSFILITNETLVNLPEKNTGGLKSYVKWLELV